jgi:hypothetical protein
MEKQITLRTPKTDESADWCYMGSPMLCCERLREAMEGDWKFTAEELRQVDASPTLTVYVKTSQRGEWKVDRYNLLYNQHYYVNLYSFFANWLPDERFDMWFEWEVSK